MTYLELFEVLNVPSWRMPNIPNSSANKTANVSSLLQFSIPEGKLFYPEPFIASPSYLHSDLPFLHIFQYWYWLWFLFIFLICFFFVSFISTVRWCTVRVRPRRETRGVSRSKCGDLITACVPVSWAMSIIVNESTDAIDLNDGFGTAELVVGVRAYQWGWEYYYPKSIDLNYNVKSSYSTFVGNSLQYKSSSSKNIASNFLWKMYQNEAEDGVVTPAHLLLIPSDSNNAVNFLNFRDIGVNTLRESAAFAKIRNYSKIYSTHLVHTPSTFTNKYQQLHALYVDENSFLGTSSFGVSKQHNSHSLSSIGNNFTSTVLDSQSFSQFLNSTSGLEWAANDSVQRMAISPSTSTKNSAINTPLDSNRVTSLLEKNLAQPSSKLSSYPTSLGHLNDNSDKDGLAYPSLQLSNSKLQSAVWKNSDLLFTQNNLDSLTSTTAPYSNLTQTNESSNSRVFNLSGPNSKVQLNDQSIRNLPTTNLTKANLNFSADVNTTASNLVWAERTNTATTPYSQACSMSAGCVDNALTAHATSTQSLSHTPHPAVLTSSPLGSNSLSYDSSATQTHQTAYAKEGTLNDTTQINRKSPVGDVFIGSREKTPRSINTAYWDTFWATSTSSHRMSNALKSNMARSNFFLPSFSNYVDYDFRNDQALDMLEELFWEHSFSGYNFYDYVTISESSNANQSTTPKELSLGAHSASSTLGLESTATLLALNTTKDLSSIGNSYGNSVQMEGYSTNSTTTTTSDFMFLPLYSEMDELEDSFSNFKQMSYLFSQVAASNIGLSSHMFGSRSYLSVFNTFRNDFSDFTWHQTGPDSLAYSATPAAADFLNNDGSSTGNDLRLSNPATLRSSVRNSIVNSNAFQKVFKARLDEGRAHVQANSFADLALKQPFLSDVKVPYLQLLGKNRNSFFETPLYSTDTHLSFNSAAALTASLNTPTYSFPFLLSKTSDTARFTWIDWFSKWRYVEVQPSSVSRYSTLGVPYLRKPFDFNSATGDKFQDTELYFTRIARSRRNYLTNWSYSPFMYNRSYVWNSLSKLDSFLLNDYASLSSIKSTCQEMHWYWSAPTFHSNTTETQTFSSSGNDVYGKSTWRPRTSIQSYYYNTSKLVDILSRREHMYRLYLSKSYEVTQLPTTLCATPNNPLLAELKSSFLFSDPATFSSEFSRDFLYCSTSYLKFLYFKTLSQSVLAAAETLPVNATALTKYAFFYFFSLDSTSNGKTSELYKSQFRPLRKGISSMLRLHSTGAVAMPIEIRLQVLASSRDVIHSWSIPSAHVKIDCVPGYTSHRIMKFLLTGVYWGQCQEICGRYHHWMPIVVYFMKPDLFVLWCVHFVLIPSNTEHRNSSNDWFSSPLSTVSSEQTPLTT